MILVQEYQLTRTSVGDSNNSLHSSGHVIITFGLVLQ